MHHRRQRLRGLSVLLALALSACAGAATSVVGRPCGLKTPCPAPATCDLDRGVCVLRLDLGFVTLPDTGASDTQKPTDLLQGDTTHPDSFFGPDSGCPSPLADCAGICVNLGTDVDNCGGCGSKCGVHATCAESCACSAGYFNCDGSWSNGCECSGGCSGTSCQAPKLPNWSNCSTDGECQSSWCGCNGGTIKQCLPNQTYSKTCGAGLPNWSNCTYDGDCTSQWCGCNGGTIKQCLPNQTYPKTCT